MASEFSCEAPPVRCRADRAVEAPAFRRHQGLIPCLHARRLRDQAFVGLFRGLDQWLMGWSGLFRCFLRSLFLEFFNIDTHFREAVLHHALRGFRTFETG